MDSQQLHVVDIPFFDDEGNRMIYDKGNIVNEDAYNAYIGNLEEKLGGTYDPEQGAIVVDSQSNLSSENSEGSTNDAASDAADVEASAETETSADGTLPDMSSEDPGAISPDFIPTDANSETTDDIVSDAGTAGRTTNYMFTSELPYIKAINKNFISEDADDFVRKINECINYYYTNVYTSIANASSAFSQFNEKTIEKLEKNAITHDILFSSDYSTGLYPRFYRQLLNKLESIVTELTINIAKMFNTEEEPPYHPRGGTPKPLGNGGSSSGSSGGIISDNIIDNTIDTSPIIGSVTFGSIVLTSATTLYETLGGVGISANLTGNYSVIGITKENDKYYYKVIDNATKKVYYMEITDDVKFQTEYKNLLHIKENAMMLSSMEIGSDNFVKLADPNTIYFIQNETENNGITFYNVIDANDGKSYYIPGSDSVESIPLDSIASIVDTPTTETTTVTGEGV